MSIPLVQNNEKDSINTSIIAIKRNIERINMLLGLSNSEEIDTSKFATKDELQQAVTDLQPVNEVTADNMHSVTSNGVAEYANKVIKYKEVTITNITLNNQGNTDLVTYVPSGMNNFMFALLYGWSSTSTNTPIAIETNGRWLWGEPSSSANNIRIRYYYTD